MENNLAILLTAKDMPDLLTSVSKSQWLVSMKQSSKCSLCCSMDDRGRLCGRPNPAILLLAKGMPDLSTHVSKIARCWH